MKKLILVLGLSFLVIPAIAGAHGSSDFENLKSGSEMMQYMEDQILGDELHEEMENLMIKMMNGNLSESEADRLSQFMQQYPGPHGMMMNRIWNDSDSKNFNSMGWGMHSGSGNWWSLWSWFGFLGGLVWIIVGILLVVFLGKKVGDE